MALWGGRPLESQGVEIIGWRKYPGLLRESVRRQTQHIYGMARYPVLYLLDRSTGAQGNLPSPPETAWAETARRRAEEALDDIWLTHSERTWLFAAMLAQRDQQNSQQKPISRELLDVACMLHDTGLLMQSRAKCFAVAGAEQAAETAAMAGVRDEDSIQAVALAISSHVSINPGTRSANTYKLVPCSISRAPAPGTLTVQRWPGFAGSCRVMGSQPKYGANGPTSANGSPMVELHSPAGRER